jgi:hypothetical protein
VLRDPVDFGLLGVDASPTIEERASIEMADPALHDYFERVASAGPRRRD